MEDYVNESLRCTDNVLLLLYWAGDMQWKLCLVGMPHLQPHCCSSRKVEMLFKYLHWFTNRKKTGTLTKMTKVGAPQTSGQKHKATQRKKGRYNVKVTGPPTGFLQQSRIPPSD